MKRGGSLSCKKFKLHLLTINTKTKLVHNTGLVAFTILGLVATWGFLPLKIDYLLYKKLKFKNFLISLKKVEIFLINLKKAKVKLNFWEVVSYISLAARKLCRFGSRQHLFYYECLACNKSLHCNGQWGCIRNSLFELTNIYKYILKSIL